MDIWQLGSGKTIQGMTMAPTRSPEKKTTPMATPCALWRRTVVSSIFFLYPMLKQLIPCFPSRKREFRIDLQLLCSPGTPTAGFKCNFLTFLKSCSQTALLKSALPWLAKRQLCFPLDPWVSLPGRTQFCRALEETPHEICPAFNAHLRDIGLLGILLEMKWHQENLDLKFYHWYSDIFGFLILVRWGAVPHCSSFILRLLSALLMCKIYFGCRVQSSFWVQTNSISSILPTKQAFLFFSFFLLKGWLILPRSGKKALSWNTLICKFLISFVHF